MYFQTDEGAPLICMSEPQSVGIDPIKSTRQWEIQGLLSYYSRCYGNHPTIYSSLDPALSWLRESVPALQMQS